MTSVGAHFFIALAEYISYYCTISWVSFVIEVVEVGDCRDIILGRDGYDGDVF